MTDTLASTTKRPRILIVEDEAIVSMVIAVQMRYLGYEPLGPARSGEQAIAMAMRLQPKLVLMDIHLGAQIDGITAAQEIRTQSDIRCVFISAYSCEFIQAAGAADQSGGVSG